MRRLVGPVVALLLAWSAPVFAQDGGERILRFVSDVRIARSGDLDVTETIRLVAQGEAIRRGIQRDFPTRYRSALGQTTRTSFDVVAVMRDGRREPYTLMALGNGTRVRIGRADALLPRGEHVYTIRYRTRRQIAYGKDGDELYWNATGTGWTFPIDSAEARITLPAPARFDDRAAYTGPQGSTAHHAAVVAEAPGTIVFRTTQPLPRENGLTVAVAFPKGVVAAPGAGRRFGWWLRDWAPLTLAVAALVELLGYYGRAWWLVGRGPRAGTVVPLFAPPERMSAAATRYVARMALDDRAFTAAVIDLAVARHLHIRKAGDGWFSRGTTTLERTPGGRPLPAPEAAMLAALFAEGDTLALQQTNHAPIAAARTALNDALETAYCGTLFRRNRDWAIFGLLAIALAILGLALFAALLDGGAAGRAGLGMLLLAGGWWLYRRATKGFATLGGVAAATGGLFFGLPAVVDALDTGAWSVLMPLLALPVALTAFAWLYAPTREGRGVMDRIAGFKHYLGITEEHRLDTLHPPDKTPELFDRFLPYAIALDVENRWAARFAGVLAAAAEAGTAAPALGWYSGSGDVWRDPGGFVDGMGSSMASTIASASQPPGSSSGSSGGGSSGGGGGGGGGSGW